MTPALIVALPFLGALLPGILIRTGRDNTAIAVGLCSLLALLGLLLHLPAVMAGEAITAQFAWLPELGLNVNFRIDGLAMLFATLILGIGLLIIIYARFYLAKEDPAGSSTPI